MLSLGVTVIPCKYRQDISLKLDSLAYVPQGCGLGLDISVSRRSRDVYQRLVSVSSREKLSTSRSRLGLGHLRLVRKTMH